MWEGVSTLSPRGIPAKTTRPSGGVLRSCCGLELGFLSDMSTYSSRMEGGRSPLQLPNKPPQKISRAHVFFPFLCHSFVLLSSDLLRAYHMPDAVSHSGQDRHGLCSPGA